ncbi:MAG: hypothetical protein CMK56_04185 [Proteobacteria bacterium]|nr:hypothetical protein [Pseudomonadota bacterium]|tara:strand:- start:391 stop:606 length:216 start_codon:yes stop_codon:yes gene_type:complete
MQISSKIFLIAILLAFFFPWSLVILYLCVGSKMTAALISKIMDNRHTLVAALTAGGLGLSFMLVWLYRLLK